MMCRLRSPGKAPFGIKFANGPVGAHAGAIYIERGLTPSRFARVGWVSVRGKTVFSPNHRVLPAHTAPGFFHPPSRSGRRVCWPEAMAYLPGAGGGGTPAGGAGGVTPDGGAEGGAGGAEGDPPPGGRGGAPRPGPRLDAGPGPGSGPRGGGGFTRPGPGPNGGAMRGGGREFSRPDPGPSGGVMPGG
jgi:hypothetical protein